MSAPETPVCNARRRILYTAVNSLCFEVGFEVAEKAVVETLTEMLQSLLFEIGRSSRSFCELASRTEVVLGDVVMALVEMGVNIDNLQTYAKRSNRTSLPSVGIATATQTPKILQAGQKRSHPSHIPEHLPPFPDPHAYIRTATYKQPVTEYEAIREKAASQKRDVERALTRFVAKTGDTHSLFNDDGNLFPLIACKAMPHPYLLSLLPKDQVFDEDEASKDEEVVMAQKGKSGENEDTSGESSQRKDESDLDLIDNPYLRPIKMPRKRRH